MEAATPLPFSQIRVVGDTVRVDGLVVRDETVLRLVVESAKPDALISDAIEIGARVLDRESTGANVDFVRHELEKVGRDLDTVFTEKAGAVAAQLASKVDEVFAPDAGTLDRALAQHFSDGSSTAVQHRVKAVIEQVMSQSREELRRQFAADDPSNPLAAFQRQQLAVIRTANEAQTAQLKTVAEQMVAMQAEISRLRAQEEGEAALGAEREKGTSKGRTYEEAVFDAVDAVCVARGDDCDATGDTRGEGGKSGDVVVNIDACAGPGRGRIVFEAKDRKLSKNKALEELDEALVTRGADYAVLVVPTEDELPARTHPLREFNANKCFVVYDPEEESRLALEVAYGLARARVLMGRDDGAELDVSAIAAEVERAEQAMEAVRKIKSQLTNATTGIETARGLVDAMAATVRGHLSEVDALLRPAEDAAGGADGD